MIESAKIEEYVKKSDAFAIFLSAGGCVLTLSTMRSFLKYPDGSEVDLNNKDIIEIFRGDDAEITELQIKDKNTLQEVFYMTCPTQTMIRN